MSELTASLILRLVDRWSAPARGATRALDALQRASMAGIRTGEIAARNSARLGSGLNCTSM